MSGTVPATDGELQLRHVMH